MGKTAVIIGAGPAGLTAGLELLRRTDIKPIILEASEEIGGISRTIKYKGNRMDIGGHRFFSKSDRVMEWWMELMPPDVEDTASEPHEGQTEISYQGKRRVVAVPAHLHEEPVLRGAGPIDHHAAEVTEEEEEPDPEDAEILVEVAPHDPDLVMLIRPRKSRIYYLRKFFDYPITLTGTTLKNLGLVRTFRVGTSYMKSRVSQITPEKSLEDFLINRFGRQLYLTFF
jgi:protoporphyrinogen oxidase